MNIELGNRSLRVERILAANNRRLEKEHCLWYPTVSAPCQLHSCKCAIISETFDSFWDFSTVHLMTYSVHWSMTAAVWLYPWSMKFSVSGIRGRKRSSFHQMNTLWTVNYNFFCLYTYLWVKSLCRLRSPWTPVSSRLILLFLNYLRYAQFRLSP